MRLGDWMAQEHISQDELATKLGCDRSTVTRYVGGKRRPRAGMMRRIRSVTNGAVTANDFVGLDEDDEDEETTPSVTAA